MNLLEFLCDINKKAIKMGATSCDSVLIDDFTSQLSVRLGKHEDTEYARGKGFGLRVFVGEKNAIVSSNNFSLENANMLIERSINMAKNSVEDKFSYLPVDNLFSGRLDLDLYDKTEISVEKMQAIARECEDAALSVKGITNSSGAEFSVSKSHVIYAASNGFASEYKATTFSLATSVIAEGEGGTMETDYDYDSARYFTDLNQPLNIGKKAAENTLLKLNPRKISTTEASVIFPPRFANRLLSEFSACINGSAICRKSSFLQEMMDKQIFPSGVSICDNPHIIRGHRSRVFDLEGLETKKLSIVENGVLKTWILDTRSACQLGLKSTASASRGIASSPSPSTSNFYMEASNTEPDEIIKNTKKGLIITTLFGGGVNGLTGDYSQGASGLWVENGEIMYPVAEITIASNLKDMFKELVHANDLEFKYGINAPTIMIPKMTIAGS